MRFRLTYDGPLLSSQPTHLTDKCGNPTPDKRGEHKHRIRQHFHHQLKEQWATNKFLRFARYSASDASLFPEAALQWPFDKNKMYPLKELLSECYTHHKDVGYKYVPLVWVDMSLACSLRILCLRKDHDDAVLPGRDIDNRMKTLVDALRMPSLGQGPPMRDGNVLPPSDDEKPFFVLLDDDRRITHLEVETDADLAPAPAGTDESYVRMVITVDVRPTTFLMDNLSFS